MDADVTFTGENSGDRAGMSIASAGDVNGNNYDDFLIGAFKNDDAASNAGKVYVNKGHEETLGPDHPDQRVGMSGPEAYAPFFLDFTPSVLPVCQPMKKPNTQIRKTHELIQKIKNEFKKGIVGQEEMVDNLILVLLTGGHVLIEGVPGLAKTRSVRILADMCQTSFQRLQFTPDLLPADVVGTQIYNQNEGRFSIKKGPIFAHFILADEINRAPAKVQSALLEAMQERQVTIAEESFPLPRPFFVFATQNPIEQEGTYPLPEAQVDRFLLKLVVKYPKKEQERDIIKMVIDEVAFPKVNTLLDPDKIIDLQRVTRTVFIEEKIIDYITNLVFASRVPKDYGMDNLTDIIDVGASPRASIYLAMVAKAHALMENRDTVIPEDVKAIAMPVLRHRIIPTYQADAEGIKSEQIVDEILRKTKVP